MRASRVGSNSLHQETLLSDESSDPMGSMGNLMDVMLVFACGLLLALIANWNVDLNAVQSGATQDTGSQEGQDASIVMVEGDIEEVESGIQADDGTYESLGTAYRNEETGEIYIVE
jgi:hypothetical protein